MIYYLTLGLSGVMFSILIIVFRKHFFKLAENTLALLNVLLSEEDDDIKQKKILRRLGPELISLFSVIALFIIVIIGLILPVYVYIIINHTTKDAIDLRSFWFILSITIGSIVPFVVKSQLTKKSDYSEISILFHRIILNNYNVSKFLFGIDKYFKKEKNINEQQNFVIVSGLARAGTTSLTTQLFQLGKFSSLDYSNMPMLLSPNLWRKFYSPKKENLKERSHGDSVLFGLNTIEALEEYFFKAFLNDSFISENHLSNHNISQEVYEKYIKYQSLIRTTSDSIYLAKNNNLLLRLKSLREFNSDFKVIFMFRDPLSHANSLLKQHQRFSVLQQENSFTLEYMNWLCHHEFGLNQKVFKFENEEVAINETDKFSINYWLLVWINYYKYFLKQKDDNIYLIDYEDYLKRPEKVFKYLNEVLSLPISDNKIDLFNKDNAVDISADPVILKSALEVYNLLQNRKINLG